MSPTQNEPQTNPIKTSSTGSLPSKTGVQEEPIENTSEDHCLTLAFWKDLLPKKLLSRAEKYRVKNIDEWHLLSQTVVQEDPSKHNREWHLPSKADKLSRTSKNGLLLPKSSSRKSQLRTPMSALCLRKLSAKESLPSTSTNGLCLPKLSKGLSWTPPNVLCLPNWRPGRVYREHRRREWTLPSKTGKELSKHTHECPLPSNVVKGPAKHARTTSAFQS